MNIIAFILMLSATFRFKGISSPLDRFSSKGARGTASARLCSLAASNCSIWQICRG